MFGSDIHQRIKAEYGASAPAVIQELEKFIASFRALYGTHPSDRVIRCIVHLAARKREDVTYGIEVALRDWRDVIYSAEYDGADKRIRDFNQRFPD